MLGHLAIVLCCSNSCCFFVSMSFAIGCLLDIIPCVLHVLSVGHPCLVLSSPNYLNLSASECLSLSFEKDLPLVFPVVPLFSFPRSIASSLSPFVSLSSSLHVSLFLSFSKNGDISIFHNVSVRDARK